MIKDFNYNKELQELMVPYERGVWLFFGVPFELAQRLRRCEKYQRAMFISEHIRPLYRRVQV